ncbi:unnamed protein product, partial [Protopolystoma xenopodis]
RKQADEAADDDDVNEEEAEATLRPGSEHKSGLMAALGSGMYGGLEFYHTDLQKVEKDLFNRCAITRKFINACVYGCLHAVHFILSTSSGQIF